MKDEIDDRLERNVDRVRGLVANYKKLSGRGQGRRAVKEGDVLRAAIVLLHASLEDFLRSLEEWKLPLAVEDTLNTVPLVGTQGRAEKFMLGKLANHRGKSVQKLIADSVHEHLQRSNYNNTEEVSATLLRIGIDPSTVNSRYSEIQELMQRRHNIVHRADNNTSRGRGHFRVKTISEPTVNDYIDAVECFARDVLVQV